MLRHDNARNERLTAQRRLKTAGGCRVAGDVRVRPWDGWRAGAGGVRAAWQRAGEDVRHAGGGRVVGSSGRCAVKGSLRAFVRARRTVLSQHFWDIWIS